MTADKTARFRTASEFVADYLRTGILSGELGAGEKLRQNHIAAELGVSSTPVREALRDLVAEGLVVSDTHKGNTVRGLTLADVVEIYDLRLMLEPLLIERNFSHIRNIDFARCEDLLLKMETTNDVTEWSRLNAEFHTLLGGSAPSSRLAKIIDGLRDASMPYVTLSLYGQEHELVRSRIEHKQLVEAYREADLARVIALTKAHLGSTIKIIHNKLKRPE